MPRIAAAVTALLLLLRAAPHAQPVDPTPHMQVETGTHQAAINRMALLPGDNTIATVSDDKTARLWSIDTLTPLGVIRPAIGRGDDGALDAVASSGKVLALGGRIRYGAQFGVQFYRLSDLKLVGHRSELPAPVSALRFSRAGDILAVGMVGGRGLAFFDMRNGAQVGADIAYTGQVQWIDMDAQGRAVTTGEDGVIRLYGPDHRKVADATLPRDGHPYGVAFSPDGRTIAAGVQNGATVWLLDAATLRPRASLTGAPGRIGGFAVPTFTADGAALIAGGTYKSGPNGPRLLRWWALNGSKAAEFEAGSDTVTDLVASGPGLVFSNAEPVIARLDANGHRVAEQAAHHTDFRDAGLSGFGVSQDGSVVELPLVRGAPGWLFDMRLRTLTAASPRADMQRPHEGNAGLDVTNWRNAATPLINGRPLALELGEVSLAAAAGRDGVAVGTNFYVRYQPRSGIPWKIDVPSPAWAINISGNGQRIVVGLGDGTVRWYDVATRNALLTLFVDPAHRHWVAATEEGFFDHDIAPPSQPDGRTLIGYRFNDSAGELSRFIDTGQLYPIYYRPDLVGLALSPNPAARAAIQQAYARRGTVDAVLMRGLPAQLELLSACGSAENAKDATCPAEASADPQPPSHYAGSRLVTRDPAVLVRYRLNNPDGEPGVAVVSRNGAHISARRFTISEDRHRRTEAALIPLASGVNTIRLLPVTANGEIEGDEKAAVTFEVVRDTIAQPASPTTPHPRTLYLLSVGISHYSSAATIGLVNARNDAAAMAAVMSPADPPIYEAREVASLYDGQATLSAITDAIQAIVEKAQPDDIVLLFFAGHGKNVDGRYFFAPSDFATRNPDLVKMWQADGQAAEEAEDQLYRQEGLGHDRLLSLLQSVKASRLVVVLDTCYSATLATQDTVMLRDSNHTVTQSLGMATGRFVLSSATDEAIDSSTVPGEEGNSNHQAHGLFTGYLLDALEGRADESHTGDIDVKQISDFTKRMVHLATARTEREQVPSYFFAGNDFFALRTARNLRNHAEGSAK